MYFGQGVDIVAQVKAEIDRRVGEFYLAKSRLSRVEQLVNAMKGKVDPAIYDEKVSQVSKLKTESLALTKELGDVSAESGKANPDYFKMSGAIGVFSRMDTFVASLSALENDVEGKAKGVGISLEPFNWLTMFSLGMVAMGLLTKIFGKKR